jgi:D-amino peptidase
MRIYVQTDLEGVAGVINVDDYLAPSGRYYDKARCLLTEEVNAAVRGLGRGGFDDIVVADGHGRGGIDIELLDSRARLMRGWPTGWPLLLDRSYDALAFVGQHAKAGTPYAHIPHTQWWNYLDLSVNGVSVGEYGQLVLCANELDIPVIFAAGDAAFCREVKELTPWVETVAGKEGTAPGSGDELDAEAYSHSHETAIHRHPVLVRQAIEEAAFKAAQRFAGDPQTFGRLSVAPPCRLVARFRKHGDSAPHVVEREHPSSISQLLNAL